MVINTCRKEEIVFIISIKNQDSSSAHLQLILNMYATRFRDSIAQHNCVEHTIVAANLSGTQLLAS